MWWSVSGLEDSQGVAAAPARLVPACAILSLLLAECKLGLRGNSFGGVVYPGPGGVEW